MARELLHRDRVATGATPRRAERGKYDRAPVAVLVETARQEWEESLRRLEAERGDPARYEPLLAQVEAVGEELARRVGGAFTLAELAEAYCHADHWSREAVSERAGMPAWPGWLAAVQGAAFELYSHAASDYKP